MELLPKGVAETRPNGYRRDEPNEYPVLPKPDRPETSFNPLNPMGWMKIGGNTAVRSAIADPIALQVKHCGSS